jgi:16S rRNA (guanine(966)-N(2))-methyltransferase RsmD
MRVITGTAKGKPLKTLSGRDTRPTTDAAKETMFSAVQFEVDGATVLDLFAGSGQLGIEALSRGAKFAYFADINRDAIAIVRQNLEYTHLSERAFAKQLPYAAFLRLLKDKIDIAFLDPPYGKGLIAKAVAGLSTKMADSGIIVCEHERELCLPEKVDTFIKASVYQKSSLSITVYRREKV